MLSARDRVMRDDDDIRHGSLTVFSGSILTPCKVSFNMARNYEGRPFAELEWSLFFEV